MSKIIIMMLMIFNAVAHAQNIGHPAVDRRTDLEKEFNVGFFSQPNVTHLDNGITDIQISFEDQNKTIYFEKVNLKNFTVIKGDKLLPKYLIKYIDDYKIITVPLEADYIIKYKNFIIESNNKKLYLNKKEVLTSVLIKDNNKVIMNGFINHSEEPMKSIKKQSYSCLNNKIKLNPKNHDEFYQNRYNMTVEKVNYINSDIFPYVEFFFKDQLKTVFFKQLDIKNMTLVKGNRVIYNNTIKNGENYNFTKFYLEGDYIIKNKDFIIESKGNQLFINNKEICFNAVIDKNNKINFEVYDELVKKIREIN